MLPQFPVPNQPDPPAIHQQVKQLNTQHSNLMRTRRQEGMESIQALGRIALDSTMGR